VQETWDAAQIVAEQKKAAAVQEAAMKVHKG